MRILGIDRNGFYIVEDILESTAVVTLDEGKVNDLMSMVTPKLSIYKVLYRERRKPDSEVIEDYLFSYSIEEAIKRFRKECRDYTLLKIRKLWT